MVAQIAYAQGAQKPNPDPPVDSLKKEKNYDNNQMDVFDVLSWLFKHPKWLKRRKDDSPGPFIVVIPYPSYTIATGVEGVAPINISFYTNPKERTQLSFFNNNFQYTQFKQIIALSVSNVYFGHDKWELIGDYRFYNFPTYTYGLGSETSLLNEDGISYNQVRFYQLVMRQVVPNVITTIITALPILMRKMALPPIFKLMDSTPAARHRERQSIYCSIPVTIQIHR